MPHNLRLKSFLRYLIIRDNHFCVSSDKNAQALIL